VAIRVAGSPPGLTGSGVRDPPWLSLLAMAVLVVVGQRGNMQTTALFAPTRESVLSLHVMELPSLSISAGRLPPVTG